jgi:hypothetical protein
MKNKIKNFILSIDLFLVSLVYAAAAWALYYFWEVKIPDIVVYIITFVLVVILAVQTVLGLDNKTGRKSNEK